MCVFEETCGFGLALEHNGDLYSCDHFVEPDYLLGNIRDVHMLETGRLQNSNQNSGWISAIRYPDTAWIVMCALPAMVSAPRIALLKPRMVSLV